MSHRYVSQKMFLIFLIFTNQVACQATSATTNVTVTSVSQLPTVTESGDTPTIAYTNTATAMPSVTPSNTATQTTTPTQIPTSTPAITPTRRNTPIREVAHMLDGEPTVTPIPLVTRSVSSNSLIAVIASRFSGTGWPSAGEVWVVDPATNHNYQLTDRRVSSISWSPSGRQLALQVLEGTGQSWNLYMIDRDGSNLRLLKRPTPPHDAIFGPQWLSDDLILFREGQRGRNSVWRLYTISITTGVVSEFIVEGITSYHSALVSPDGQLAAVTDGSNQVQTQEGTSVRVSNTPIRIISINDRQIVASLYGAEGEQLEGYPRSWHSDNNRLIVWSYNQEPLQRCHIADVRRSTSVIMNVRRSEYECPYSFSPDGRWIATANSADDVWIGDRLMVGPFPMSGDMRRLFFEGIGQVRIRNPVWSPFLSED
jgi:dipeptidyl aminopeptidase/acylaminoacyl peptidase